MRAWLEELKEIITFEIGVQEQTLQKLESQQKFIVDHDLEDLDGNLKDLDTTLLNYRELENARQKVRTRLAEGLALKPEATLKEIIETARGRNEEGVLCAELKTLRGRLMEIATRVRAKTKQNMVLLRQSIELNHELLSKVLGNRVDRLSTYGQAGELVSTTGKGVIDAEV
ncbi:MAG: flagellar protein FlgN [Planctomycetota bacterium]|jgi:hypothetical protein